MGPVELAARGLELAGIDYVRAIFAGELPAPPIADLMGFRGVEAEPGRAVFEIVPGEQHYNPIGSVHGGVALTLLDSAMGCAVHTLLEAGVGYTTLELKANFVRPIRADTGVVRCEGTSCTPARGSRRPRAASPTAGKLLAHGTTTCSCSLGSSAWPTTVSARSIRRSSAGSSGAASTSTPALRVVASGSTAASWTRSSSTRARPPTTSSARSAAPTATASAAHGHGKPKKKRRSMLEDFLLRRVRG